MVAMAGTDIWILKPTGSVYEELPIPRKGDILKVMPVTVLKRAKMIEVPSVLAGMRSNKYLGFGTFRPIDNWGNIKALHYVLGASIPKEQMKASNCGPNQLIECLGSIELETLIAKVLEAVGCFVPAHRGGNLIAADIFATNLSSQKIDIDGLVIPAKRRVSIQIKGWSDMAKHSDVDYMFRLPKDRPLGKGEFSAEWLLRVLETRKNDPDFGRVRAWLFNSLACWLPVEFLKQYGLSRR